MDSISLVNNATASEEISQLSLNFVKPFLDKINKIHYNRITETKKELVYALCCINATMDLLHEFKLHEREDSEVIYQRYSLFVYNFFIYLPL